MQLIRWLKDFCPLYVVQKAELSLLGEGYDDDDLIHVAKILILRGPP